MARVPVLHLVPRAAGVQRCDARAAPYACCCADGYPLEMGLECVPGMADPFASPAAASPRCSACATSIPIEFIRN